MKEKRGRVMLKLLLGGTVAFSGICLYKGNHRFYSDVVMPAARFLDAETAHCWAIKLASYGILPRLPKMEKSDSLKCKVLGIDFDSPIGLAAGFDKDAECFDSLMKLGFGFVEVGTITPNPQPGNPKPRVFRLLEDDALINRYGFNSCGIEYVKQNLSSRKPGNVIGVNLGVNKNSPNALSDYERGISELGPFATYIVINVSSPNTPGLRNLQSKKYFDTLLKKVVSERNKLKNHPPLLVKIAPDLTNQDVEEICSTSVSNKIDGLIVTNTTISRESLKSSSQDEVGGLSGKPLQKKSNEMIQKVYKLTKGKVPIIGVGGVFTAHDVVEKLKCGASLVQLYTGFVYQGPTCINELNSNLTQILEEERVENVSELIGRNCKK